jgi:membrane protein DedA with SNARE-associated domain
MSGIEEQLLEWTRDFYDAVGLLGVFVMMAIETVAFPLPSEFVMPLAGWMLAEDKDRGWWYVVLLALVGGAGSTVGGLVFYYVGAWGGRPLLLKWGKYVLIGEKDLERGDRFFERHGVAAVFFSRLIPLVRSIISFPAGVARMNVVVFTIYTFAGSFLWALALAAGGYLLGENYEDIRDYLRPIEIPVAIAVVALVAAYIGKHLRDRQRRRRTRDLATEAGPEP